jgi:hypothetical protein
MGFFKGLFVEEIPNEEEMYEVESNYVEEENVEVELDSVNTDTLITDIYAQNELFDKTKSIFKVEELINSLPKEMVTETKKASVLATLGVFGLTVTDVTLDGESRIDVLSGVLTKILGEGNDTVVSKEAEIEEHKKEIARLEKEISDQKTEMKVSEDTINAEISRITGLVKFVEGGNE